MIIAKKVDKNKEKTEHFLICSVFLCFSSIIFDFLRNDFWGKSAVFAPLPQLGQGMNRGVFSKVLDTIGKTCYCDSIKPVWAKERIFLIHVFS